MAKLPIVSIVGRPNVGKSSLFNRILQKKIAVIDDTPGVTRDRNYMEATWGGHRFTLVDTGGLIPTSRESIPEEIHRQVDIALEESAVIVFVVEASTGPTDLDAMVAKRLLRGFDDKIILAVNKAEARDAALEAGRANSLGCGEPVAISALHGMGVADLLDRIVSMIRNRTEREDESGPEQELRVAVIGRPNAGKSSFVNKLLRRERMIVDNVPGTTRDAIDSRFVYHGRGIRIVDTAGLRRKSQVKDDIEYYSNLRALGSIERSDICLLMVDSTEGLTEQNLKILAHVLELRRGLVVCWNKWDLVEKDHKTFDAFSAATRRKHRELQHVPMVAISAMTGQRVWRALELALRVRERMGTKVRKKEFENKLIEWTRTRPHPIVSNKQVRFLGGKQRRAAYPLFQIFCSNAPLVIPSYRRYLINRMYETWGFEGCPVVLDFRPPGRKRGGGARPVVKENEEFKR
jgi:GTP-binding protein